MQECLFCKIIAGEVPATKIYEDDTVLALLDINPRNPGHTLVVPKKHYLTILDMPDADVGKLFETVKRIAKGVKEAVNADGLSITQSNYPAAGQVVQHMHVHIIPRFSNDMPAGLESILVVKKLDKATIDKLADNIKDKISGEEKKKGIDFNF